jgi:hypothetical protein
VREKEEYRHWALGVRQKEKDKNKRQCIIREKRSLKSLTRTIKYFSRKAMI